MEEICLVCISHDKINGAVIISFGKSIHMCHSQFPGCGDIVILKSINIGIL